MTFSPLKYKVKVSLFCHPERRKAKKKVVRLWLITMLLLFYGILTKHLYVFLTIISHATNLQKCKQKYLNLTYHSAFASSTSWGFTHISLNGITKRNTGCKKKTTKLSLSVYVLICCHIKTTEYSHIVTLTKLDESKCHRYIRDRCG
jgi:hypothetical protein